MNSKQRPSVDIPSNQPAETKVNLDQFVADQTDRMAAAIKAEGERRKALQPK